MAGCLFLYMPVCLIVYMSVCLFVYMSVAFPIHLFAMWTFQPFIFPSICHLTLYLISVCVLFACVYVRAWLCIFVCVCVYVRLYVCMCM